MKFLFIFTIMISTMLAHSSTTVCEDNGSSTTGTPFYTALLQNYSHMKQPYTAFYQSIDEKLEDDSLKFCLRLPDQSKKSLSTVISRKKTYCHSLCESKAASFHEAIGTVWRKGAKIKVLQNECKSLCDFAEQEERNYLKDKIVSIKKDPRSIANVNDSSRYPKEVNSAPKIKVRNSSKAQQQ